MTRHRLKAYILLLFVSLFWGIATPVIKFTLGGIDSASFLTYRFFLASTVGLILLFIFAKKHIRRIKKHFGQIFLYSILATTISLGLLFLGLERTTVLDTVLIASVSPLVTAVYGSVFLNETITRQERLGIGLAFAGSILTALSPVFTGRVDILQLSGNFLIIGYLLVNGYAAVLSKKLMRKNVDPLNLSNLSFVIGFVTILPFAVLKTPLPQMAENALTLSLPYQLGVLYMALISGTLAYALWVKAQKSIEVSEAGVFAYLAPVFSAPLAVWWLGEKITLYFIIGAVLITSGVFVAEYKRRR